MSTAAAETRSSPKNVRLSCRVSSVTKRRAEEAARLLGQTVTHFTEEAIAQRAEEILARHERIVLSEHDFAAFVQAINAPAAETPTSRLLADAAAYKARHAKSSTSAAS